MSEGPTSDKPRSDKPRPDKHWEGIASDWIDWVRSPGHDAFWAYRDTFLPFLPPPGQATLDLGCGVR